MLIYRWRIVEFNYQPPLLASPSYIHAYHDEVKPERDRFPFLAHGVLFVPEGYREYLLAVLSEVRSQTGFTGEIHYTRIRGGKDARFRTAQEWLKLYFMTALHHCPFKAFIVEQEGARAFPYPGEPTYPAHAAHALLSTFIAGIAWSYSKSTSITLRPVFDDSDNELDRAMSVALPGNLCSEVTLRRLQGGANYPVLDSHSTEFVTSDPLASGGGWGDAELVQLCDLLLGAAVDTLESPGRSPKTGRLKLSRSVADVLAETLRVPWFQQVPVHRRFSVSLYPDEFNLAYPAALRKANRQGALEATSMLPGF